MIQICCTIIVVAVQIQNTLMHNAHPSSSWSVVLSLFIFLPIFGVITYIIYIGWKHYMNDEDDDDNDDDTQYIHVNTQINRNTSQSPIQSPLSCELALKTSKYSFSKNMTKIREGNEYGSPPEQKEIQLENAMILEQSTIHNNPINPELNTIISEVLPENATGHSSVSEDLEYDDQHHDQSTNHDTDHALEQMYNNIEDEENSNPKHISDDDEEVP